MPLLIKHRKFHNREAQSSWDSKQGEMEDQLLTKTNAIYETTDAQTKDLELQQTAFERTVGNLLGWCWGLEPVLIAWNLTFNYDAAPNYKYIFGPHRGPLPDMIRLQDGRGVHWY